MQKKRAIKERIDRFDDVFKLTLTLLTIALAFGSYFFKDRGIIFFFGIILFYLIPLTLWGIAHLKNGDTEPILKLFSWYFLLVFIPLIYTTFLVPTLYEEQKLPPKSLVTLCITLFLGLSAYLATRKYLKICLKDDQSNRIMTTWIPIVITLFSLVIVFLGNLN